MIKNNLSVSRKPHVAQNSLIPTKKFQTKLLGNICSICRYGSANQRCTNTIHIIHFKIKNQKYTELSHAIYFNPNLRINQICGKGRRTDIFHQNRILFAINVFLLRRLSTMY